MTDEEKRLLQEELEKAGSIPALLQKIARSESKEFRLLKRQIEEGPDHPSGDELYDYVLGWMDQESSHQVMDHLVLCGKCLEEVIRIRSIEEGLTTDALERADRLTLISRIKNFISEVSFPVFLQFPALEAVRGAVLEGEPRSYGRGTEIILTLEPPADGYVAIFHGCEETGEVKLVFPLYAADNPKVSAGQEITPIKAEVEGPPGSHFFKIFWTRDLLFDISNLNTSDENQMNEAILHFFNYLGELDEEHWRVVTFEYVVSENE